ncbi:MAG: DUF2076 domain-containing protein [Rhizobiales bacterium]|nr:DUF2076 domain-containing protein [Hyphomicrobiales bacterium]
MTPQERQLVDELFDRLARLETSPREADAERAIADGLSRAPHASYALVQTVLVQDEALKRANARIQELEGGSTAPSGGFLDSMRDALLGPSTRGSVPNTGPRGPVWNSGNVLGQTDPRQAGFNGAQSGGGSFLGTAAAAAAGVIGGSILMNSIRGLMGGHQQTFGDASSIGSGSSNPWSGGSSDKLSRDAGINDIGKNNADDQRQNFADHASNDFDDDDDNDDFDAGDFDGGGDTDYA